MRDARQLLEPVLLQGQPEQRASPGQQVRQPSWESMFLLEEKGWWELSLFRIERNRKVWTSLHPESRADPPSVSHFPAAVTRGIWFRPA